MTDTPQHNDELKHLTEKELIRHRDLPGYTYSDELDEILHNFGYTIDPQGCDDGDYNTAKQRLSRLLIDARISELWNPNLRSTPGNEEWVRKRIAELEQQRKELE